MYTVPGWSYLKVLFKQEFLIIHSPFAGIETDGNGYRGVIYTPLWLLVKNGSRYKTGVFSTASMPWSCLRARPEYMRKIVA